MSGTASVMCHDSAVQAMTSSLVDEIWDEDPDLPYDDAVMRIVPKVLDDRIAEYLARADCSILHGDWY